MMQGKQLLMGTDPYQDLANAVIVQAVKDYRRARKRGDEREAEYLERFFFSPWFGALTSLDPWIIIEKVDKEVGEP